MNRKTKTVLCVLLFAPVYFLLYTFLHEAGHAIVIMAYGGTVENFVFGNFNAHVSSNGGLFTAFGTALNHIAGMLLPTIVGAIIIGFYNPNKKIRRISPMPSYCHYRVARFYACVGGFAYTAIPFAMRGHACS